MTGSQHYYRVFFDEPPLAPATSYTVTLDSGSGYNMAFQDVYPNGMLHDAYRGGRDFPGWELNARFGWVAR
jgi:hypothetical protein